VASVFSATIVSGMHQQGRANTSRYVTTGDLAAYLGVHYRTVMSWLHSGALRGEHWQTRHYTDERPRKTKLGRWRIHEADLADFLWRMRARPYAGRWRRG